MKDNITSAFPQPAEWNPQGDCINSGQSGMTLRDWFAGQALSGSLASQNPESYWAFKTFPEDVMGSDSPEKKGIAKLCYELADAMMAERSKA
jgi:hypothetical protein